jgi:hypothetical protein
MKSVFMVLSVLSFGVAQVPSAFAGSCVQQASSSELIQEISRRLGTTGPNPSSGGSVSASFICGGNAEVMATAVNLVTGVSSQISTATGDWNRCRATADTLNTRIGGNPLSGGRLYAVCGGNAQVFKIAILTDGSLKTVSSDATGDWNVCVQTAQNIDSNLQP